MKKYTLKIAGQSADLKKFPTNSKDTGIFFPQDLVDFLGTNGEYSFTIYKDDCAKAMSTIISLLPLYSNKGGKKIDHVSIYDEACRLVEIIGKFFQNSDTKIYSGLKLTTTTGGRSYLYNLEQDGFSIRRFLVADHSIITFQKEDDGNVILRFNTNIDNNNKSTIDNVIPNPIVEDINENAFKQYITAIRSKPFLLLAGISGTGKSQKVQELAFMSCPEELRETDGTTPGNYCLIEVKPNWHDSTELLGYYSALSGRYELTDFIRFTYKALMHSDTPFFLCLDEMNLAPVEQYFAEYLSVLETRKRVMVDGKVRIQTEPLLTKDKFSNCSLWKKELKIREGYTSDGDDYDKMPLYSTEDSEIIAYLKDNGLHLPDNLFVIGTVNMDDTTHQFSRKVIDRAFTIEMNGGKMEEMFSTENRNILKYRDNPISIDSFKSEFVRAYEVLEDDRFAKYAEIITEGIPKLLGNSDGTANEDSINGILNSTPFRVSYRVQNELVIYLSVLIENAGFPDNIDPLIGEATLAILMEKVLPRVQGEQKQLETKGKDGKSSNVLKDMKFFVETHFKPSNDSSLEIYDKVIKKLEEMDGKLNGYYTNFF